MTKSLNHREQAIRELVGLPGRLSRRTQAGKSRVPIAEVRRALDLPEPPCRELLAADRWLAGGAVMRWLSRGLGRPEGESRDHDYDFSVPSIEALNRTVEELVAAGLTFRAFRSIKLMCPLCGGPGRLVPRGDHEPPDPKFTILPIRCPECGELDPEDAASFPADRLLRLTPDLIRKYVVRAVELLSPRGELIQLAARGIRPTPGETVTSFDFSISQFGLDDEFLYFGPYAWTDLLRRRLRLVVRNSHYYRIRKLLAMGFRPYADTAAWCLWIWAGWLLGRLRRQWKT
ncbi:MAG: hypothetical protein GY856_04620 [bacterium]|nr:hypothetical protein [bacterium]